MKLLLDMNLPPAWVRFLQEEGFAALHWSTVGDSKATDATTMEWARRAGHVVVTHDLDFSALLAATEATGPSVIQVRTQDVLPDAIGGDEPDLPPAGNDHAPQRSLRSVRPHEDRERHSPRCVGAGSRDTPETCAGPGGSIDGVPSGSGFKSRLAGNTWTASARALVDKHRISNAKNGLATLISALTDRGAVPMHRANTMHTIRGLRNAYVHDDIPMGRRETMIAQAAWDIIREWGESSEGEVWRRTCA